MLKPKKTKDFTQAYFPTAKWQGDEAQADIDIKAGRASKIKSAKELLKDSKSPGKSTNLKIGDLTFIK